MPVKLEKLNAALTYPLRKATGVGRGLWTLQNRERVRLRDEMSETQKLVPLLMKQRNGEKWSSDDRREILKGLDRLLAISPYLVLFIMPGGLFLLPLLAWWMDKRRLRRREESLQD